MSNIERDIGEILAHQENAAGWLKSIDGKLDAHIETIHANPVEVQTNTRWRYMAMGIIALLSTGLAIAAVVL